MLGLANMPHSQPDVYALLESSFQASPNLRSHKLLPRRRDDLHSVNPAAQPLQLNTADDEEDALSQDSDRITPLASPPALSATDNGLPPTPPSNSQDEEPPTAFSPPPHPSAAVASLQSRKSSISTPVNNRSPPTPDPSPPRTTESMRTPATESLRLPERPPIFTYPSSRAESFQTAREDQSSSDGDSRSNTPQDDRLSTVAEERGLGLAFEREDGDVTPTNRMQDPFSSITDAVPDGEEHKDPLNVDDIPNREWDTNLMRNVTIRKKRDSKPSPQKISEPSDTTAPATGSSPRRSSSLRERVEASQSSPRTPSVENFARSIGWPPEANNMDDKPRDVDAKRLSSASATSTVVEAMVIVTPPQRRRTLRHSGQNLAYRRDGTSSEHDSMNLSNRDSLNSEDIPLHRLIHKRANIVSRKRASIESDTLGGDRHASPLSIRKRGTPIDSSAYTLAHQESIRRVLQPAADMMSRSNSLSRPHAPERGFHKRISSAPETTRRIQLGSPGPRTFLELSPPDSPRDVIKPSSRSPEADRMPATVQVSGLHGASPSSPTRQKRRLSEKQRYPPNFDKSLPDLPMQSSEELAIRNQEQEIIPEVTIVEVENEGPGNFHDAKSEQQPESSDQQSPIAEAHGRPTQRRGSSAEKVPTIRRGSLSSRGRSEERRRSSHSQEHRSPSGDTLLHPIDRVPTEDLPRHSYEWHHDHRRVSFDRSVSRTSEEHAMARHLFAQTTPFSQFSDTPIEVSEATAVSIFPHNNHSLLVVQQPARISGMPQGEEGVPYDAIIPSSNPHAPVEASSALLLDARDDGDSRPEQPTVTVEPSTPPMKISLPSQVDSPLKNPRAAPDPPKIMFIPPTPLDELDRQLQPAPPGPPKRSDSHPQRRLSLVQRARRYSDNFISPLLARASSNRSRYASDSHMHEAHRVPSVNDEDGSLHPFWRPRGFWDGFEDSDSDSDSEDVLPQGGDTSDVEPDSEPEQSPKKVAVLKRRLTNGFKGSGGFLIGNSLGVERHGTNRRRPHIDLPSHRTSKSPKILIQPPTFPLRTRSRSPQPLHRIEKSSSRNSTHSSGSHSLDRPRRGSRREAWRQGRKIPGVPKLQVQYIGISGMKQRLRERRAEKRRENIRRSIGTRYYVEGGTNVA